MEDVPRHITVQATSVNEDEIPLPLKGRLSLKTIDEKPPGENLTYSSHYDVFNYPRLTVLCGDLQAPIIVEVDYLNYLSYTTFKRQDGCLWYMCHTWTRTWGQGAKSGTTFINLETGERHDIPTLSYWRGNLQISPDGNLILIEAGITATSARQLLVVDISNLPLVDVIHHEKYGYGSTEISDYKFNEKSEFECTYSFYFEVFKNKIKFLHYFGENDKSNKEFLEYVKSNCTDSEKKTLLENSDYIGGMESFEDGSYVRADCVTTRKRNPERPIVNNFEKFDLKDFVNEEETVVERNVKFDNLQNDLLKNKFFSDMNIDYMTVTNLVLGDNFETFYRYMKMGLHDISGERCIFCKHKCEYY